MKNSLFLYLSQFRIFWAFRALVRRFFFWIKANLFGAGYKIGEEKSNLQSLRDLFQITQTQLFLAVIAAIVLQIVDPYLYPFYESVGLRIPDDSDYVTLLATVSGIGGVFIGLYCSSRFGSVNKSAVQSIVSKSRETISDLADEVLTVHQ